MEISQFKLPRDPQGNAVPEDYLRKRYRLPSNTKVYRNLVIRYWFRGGIKPLTIMQQEIAHDIKRPQTIYQIVKSPVYDFIELDYGLNEKTPE